MTNTATTNSIARTIASNGRVAIHLAQALTKDVAPDQFARLAAPGGEMIQSNHPCFVFGHLGLYNGYICQMVGNEETAKKLAAPDGWDDLFGMGKECRDDADGSIYPAMDAVMKQFIDGFGHACNVVEEAGDEPLNVELPEDSEFRSRMGFSTNGDGVNFMLTIHSQLHLGQVSAWRRMIGLGSALGF